MRVWSVHLGCTQAAASAWVIKLISCLNMEDNKGGGVHHTVLPFKLATDQLVLHTD